MINKLIAAAAVAGCFALFAPQAANAAEPVMIVKPGHRTVAVQTTQTERAITSTVDRLNSRAAANPTYGDQLASAASDGNTKALTSLLASDGATVVSAGQQTMSVRSVSVSLTVCVTVWDTTICGGITVTFDR